LPTLPSVICSLLLQGRGQGLVSAVRTPVSEAQKRERKGAASRTQKWKALYRKTVQVDRIWFRIEKNLIFAQVAKQ
jgi:hypothetical protein